MYTATQTAQAILNGSKPMPPMPSRPTGYPLPAVPSTERAFHLDSCDFSESDSLYAGARLFGNIALSQQHGGELPPVFMKGRNVFVNPVHARSVLEGRGQRCGLADDLLGAGESGLTPLASLGGASAGPRPDALVAMSYETHSFGDEMLCSGRAELPTTFADNYSLAPVDEYQVMRAQNAARLKATQQRRVQLTMAAFERM